jgi:alpha-tubulin suppressor-like RCC1 family protein
VPGLGPASAIATGDGFSCALTSVGGLKCWGLDGNGQLGDGGRCGTPCPQPVDVSGLSSNVVAIAAGGTHACAVTVQGAARCWGWNAVGQLGDGRACGYTACLPTQVVGLTTGVVAIAAGGGHTCALKTTGGVTCWGFSAYGQLGGGGQSCEWADCLLPGDVPSLTSGVAGISAGEGHTCAVTTGGGAKCWGLDASGQVSGDPTTCAQSECLAPRDVDGLTGGVATIAAGGSHSCALLVGGRVKCWGWNVWEQLGDGTTRSRLGPVGVAGFGAEYCFVPYVEQMGRPAAVRKTRAAGCTAKVRFVYSALFRTGRVIEQTPYAGTRLRVGGRVHLVVSKGRNRKRR